MALPNLTRLTELSESSAGCIRAKFFRAANGAVWGESPSLGAHLRVESVDGAGVDVACPDGALVPGMPITVRVATSAGVAFVQLGVERIESTGAWAHARLRASAVLSVDGERRFSRCRYAGTVWLGGRRAGAAEGEVVDLSAVGIRFRTASRLDPDVELELALEVPGQQPITMRAQVLRMRPLDDGRSEVAAEVTSLESDDWARLERLLAS